MGLGQNGARVGRTCVRSQVGPGSPRAGVGEFGPHPPRALLRASTCSQFTPGTGRSTPGSWMASGATDLPRTRSAFRGFYRPREALFAMACHVCDAPEHSSLVANIVGSRRISAKADEADFDPRFDYIKESLGGSYRPVLPLRNGARGRADRGGAVERIPL